MCAVGGWRTWLSELRICATRSARLSAAGIRTHSLEICGHGEDWSSANPNTSRNAAILWRSRVFGNSRNRPII